MIHERYQKAAEYWQHDYRVRRFYAPLARPTRVATAVLALSATQSLPYKRERIDALKPPPRTLEEGGDCEDLAVLLVAGALSIGLQGIVVFMPMPGPQDHVSAQLRVGNNFLWAEPTLRARLGEHPLAAARRLNMERW